MNAFVLHLLTNILSVTIIRYERCCGDEIWYVVSMPILYGGLLYKLGYYFWTHSTVCPRSSFSFYVVSYYIKWVTLLGHTVEFSRISFGGLSSCLKFFWYDTIFLFLERAKRFPTFMASISSLQTNSPENEHSALGKYYHEWKNALHPS